MPQQHLNYDVPPTSGGSATLSFDTGASGLLTNFRFMCGGSQDLRVQRVVGNTGAPDVSFVDAAPHDVTLFFNNNPFTTDSNQFNFTVTNADTRTVKLAVSALWQT